VRQAWHRGSVEHAAAYIEACLHLSEFPAHPVAPHDIDLFHTIATVKVPDEVSFDFGSADADIRFVPELDHYNFRELSRGELLGRLAAGSQARLNVLDERGEDVGASLFDYRAGEITLRQALMPAMLTCDERVIRQDCLCYLMERISLP
jgi:hypothetical protein